ncbi:MAG: sulfatase-like hydrolase/transferase, partial [Dyella sp.]|nr:sulfatase-like hydrolase/transferase [Dyella sp.]
MFPPWQRSTLLKSLTTVVATALLVVGAVTMEPSAVKARPAQDQQQEQGDNGKPNILVIFGDDVGQSNISAYSMGLVGYRTPNIDRIAREGMIFTDYYAENSCTAGRATFIT